jgi:M6 family metalloprotease-like protein
VRHPAPRRAPFPSILLLVLLAGSALAASPPFPGKKGPQAPRYGRAHAPELEPPPPFQTGFRSPTLGAQTYNVLAVRLAFSDTPIDSSTAYYDRLLFFLDQYWNQASDGQVTLSTTLADSVFTLPQTMAYYGDDDHFQERLVYMVRDMVALADSTIDFRPYQAIVLFHAGAGQEADVFDDSREQVWSAFVTQDDFKTVLPDTTGAGHVGIATNDLIAPGVPYRVDEAVEVPELESQDGYFFGPFGVLFHEFGHQMGTLRGQVAMPDLYDTTPDEGGYSQGIGAWDLMGGGVWNANGFVPAGLSAWTRSWMGFIQPTRVTVDGPQSLIGLESAGASPRALQIPITQSEYFLIENRRHDPDGNGTFTFDDANQDGCFDFYQDSFAGAEFDFFLPANLAPPSGPGCDAGTYLSGDGVLIYHVDDAKIAAGLADNTVEGDTQRKGIDVEEADGVQDLDDLPSSFNAGSPDDVFRAGWRDQFTPTTNPSTSAYPSVRTGISVTSISAPDSVMTMSISFSRDRNGWPKTLGGRIRGLALVAADLDGDDSLELVVPIQRLNNTGALYVFRADGRNYLDGDTNPAPFTVTTAAPTSSPCVGDIDGVPGLEIVFQTLDSKIYAFHANGTEVLDGDANPATQGVLYAPAGNLTTRAQPILADLDGDGAMEVITGSSPTNLGGSTLRVVSLGGGVRKVYSIPMGGSTEGAPVAADLNGDGYPEVLVANTPAAGDEFSASGLSLVNWPILTDNFLLTSPDQYANFQILQSAPLSAPVLADIDRDGTLDVMEADSQGRIHAFRVEVAEHQLGIPPSDEAAVSELVGWPAKVSAVGRTSEVSLGDLEKDGYPETFHTGHQVEVTALHYNAAPRSGFPLHPAAPFADADTAGFWPPLVADVDGDGVGDLVLILPDGRRPAYRSDGAPIPSFVELGSTGPGSPPILLDLDGNGSAEWAESYDAPPTQSMITVRDPWLPVAASAVTWGQYRLTATRNAVLPTGAASPPGGTQALSAVYGYPNPSRNGTTTIHYRLAEAATSVSVRILDPTGALVADLPTRVGDLAGAAEHAVFWDNRSVASGVYVCRIEVHSSRGTEVKFASLAVIR